MRLVSISILSFGFFCYCQNSDDSNNPFSLTDFEEVTEKEQESLGAIEKCGDGASRGVNICVPYYMCDGKTKTIVQTGNTDGFGIIDIRFGANSCDHPLDVCCKIPTNDNQPQPNPPIVPRPNPPTAPSLDPSPASPLPPPKSNFCGIRNPDGIDFKMTGNKNNEAEYGEFPWMVALLKTNYNPSVDPVLAVCGGSLITPIIVLTGAHCVHKYSPSDIRVRAGEWDTQTDKERLPYQERNVGNIISHENFNPQTLFNDVALIILTNPFDKADNIGTICLPPHGLVAKSRNCFASGWGKNVFGREGQYQVILKKIELPVMQNNQCQDALRSTRLSKHFQLHDSFMCAGGQLGKDTCTGDGGSPLVCPDPNNPKRYIQAGIVAWGIGCGENKIPGVYGDVSKFRNWIDDHLTRLNFDTNPYNV